MRLHPGPAAQEVAFSSDPDALWSAPAVGLPFVPGSPPPPTTATALTALGTDIERLARQLGGTDERSCLVVPSHGLLAPELLVFVPVLQPDAAGIREAAAALARQARGHNLLATSLPEAAPAHPTAVEAAAEGLLLGLRQFDRYRSGAGHATPTGLTVVDGRLDGDEVVAAAVRRATTVAIATNWARDLVDTPAADLGPEELARELAAAAAADGIACRVWPVDELREGGFGGLIAVGEGSTRPPCLVELRYRGVRNGTAPVVLIGKGITYDAGGLDMKQLPQLLGMKRDMAGAAAVAAAVRAASALQLPVDVVGLLPLAENMPDGAALRPGDVVRHADGTTSEVVAPDAEGRLVLADILVHARTFDPSVIIDVATLTGGGGLGPDLWAVIGNDRPLVDGLVAAGAACGDHGWELPHWRRYRRFLVSDIADRRNQGGPFRYGFDTLLGALFLEDFCGATPWAHLDISAAASRDATTASDAWPVGATGSPTRALVAWLAGRAEHLEPVTG